MLATRTQIKTNFQQPVKGAATKNMKKNYSEMYLPGQFFIIPNSNKIESTYEQIALEKNTIYIESNVKYLKVIDNKNRQIGVFIGLVIDYRNEVILTSSVKVDFSLQNDEIFINKLEEFIYGFSGSWLFIFDVAEYQRVYLDACGSYSLVYSRDKQIASSSTCLILDQNEYESEFDKNLFISLEVNKSGWFPAGLTAHKNIFRLFCNHYLDLNKWESIRHWPNKEINSSEPLPKIAYNIHTAIQRSIKALTKNGQVALTLTGGKDSRLILACCKEFIADLTLVTIDFPSREKDVFISKKLSTKFGFNHLVLPPVKATDEQQNDWLIKVSHCVGGINQYYSPSLEPLKEICKFLIVGTAGEIGRAFLWRSSDTLETVISSNELIARLGLDNNNHILKTSVDKWLEEVKNFNLFLILDLAYAELRVSPWVFAQSYAYEGRDKFIEISPFVCREVIENLLSLPQEIRKNDIWIPYIIKTNWQELLDIPFNKYGGINDLYDYIIKMFEPGKIKMKLRKTLIARLSRLIKI